jgi:uncharacterized membrane protein YfhO
MRREDISRISMDLEDLLMDEAKKQEQKEMDTDILSQLQSRTRTVLPEDEPAQTPDTGNENNRARKKRKVRPARKKSRDFIRSRDGLIAAFLIPMVIMIIIFIQRKIFPFGEESFLRTDMYHQYAPFFSEFQYKLRHGGSLLYSWDVGLGVNFSALYAYYLASPLNWLILLCPKGLVIEFMTYMIVLKTGLAGLSMAWYLRKSHRTNDFGVAFFGIFYALSGYMAAYSWNIMWLDCIVLFPVIMLGLERLVHKGRGMLYCAALGMSILSNYYISIMTCIFMVFWFIALLILEEKMSWEKFISRAFQFAIYSLLAGGLAALVLLPEIYALQMTASGDVTFPKTFTQYFPIVDMLARHIGNVQSEIGLDHWPNIYCGVAVLMFFVLYLLAEKISIREKTVYCIMLLFFLASFSINVLNFIWHGFHYPNSLPCRQSYIYIFLVLTICFRAYLHLGEISSKQIMKAFWGAVIFVIAAQKLVTGDDFHFVVFYVAILFLALYLALIFLGRRGANFRHVALLAALVIVSVEAAVNMTVTSVTTTSRTAYIRDNASVERLVQSVQPGDTFFRVEKVTRKTKNDGAWMNFPSVSLFSSTANADLSALFKKLGCESSTNAYSITGSTPLMDSFFAVKYGLYSEQPMSSKLREYIAEDEGTYLYENTYTLPLGFVVDSDFESRWDLQLGSPAEVQNSLAEAVDAEHVLVLASDVVRDGNTITFTPTTDGEYYAFVSNKKIDKVTAVTADGTKSFSNVDRGFLLELGYCPAGQSVTLTADGSEDLFANIYRFSEDGLISVYEALAECSWNLSQWTDTSLSGTVISPNGGKLFTTIPYDGGWTILVDGKEQPISRMLDDAFIGVELSPGRHTVEMHYMPKGLKIGALISLISLAILIAVFLVSRSMRRPLVRRKKERKEKKIPEENVHEESFHESDYHESDVHESDYHESDYHEEDFHEEDFQDASEQKPGIFLKPRKKAGKRRDDYDDDMNEYFEEIDWRNNRPFTSKNKE